MDIHTYTTGHCDTCNCNWSTPESANQITYVNRYGNGIEDTLEEVSSHYDSDDASPYASSENEDDSESEYDSDDYDYNDNDFNDDGNQDNNPHDVQECDDISPPNELDGNREINVGEPDIVDEPTDLNTPPQTRSTSNPIINTPVRVINRPIP